MSLFKRFLRSSGEGGEQRNAGTPPAGMQTMGASLQRKFAKGVQYNTALAWYGRATYCFVFRSLCEVRGCYDGVDVCRECVSLWSLQVASIQWNYRATDDVVKVEVWDVVDKGKKRRKLEGLKLGNEEHPVMEEPCLDAEFLDVYKGTHGVIFVFDITKQWTFSYVEREVEKVPHHIPVLILGNHRDMGHHRTVSSERANSLAESLQAERPEGSGQVRYAESSMRNGFGLKYLHMFFNLPFLQLQRETLLKQLEVNAQDMISTTQELAIHEESEEQNYEVFQESLTARRRQQQEKLSEKALSSAQFRQDSTGKLVANNDSAAAALPSTATPTATVPRSASQPAMPRVPSSNSMDKPVSQPQATPTVRASQSENSTPATTPQTETKTGLFSRLFKSKGPDNNGAVSKPRTDCRVDEGPVVKSVDDFVPDEDAMDSSFLDDAKDLARDNKDASREEDDSDDDIGGNPMVAGFQDDLDSDDDLRTPATSKPSATTASQAVKADIDISSEEEDEGGVSGRSQVVTADADLSSDEDLRQANPAVSAVTVDITDSEDEVSQAQKDRGAEKHGGKSSREGRKGKNRKQDGATVEKKVAMTAKKTAMVVAGDSGGEGESSSQEVAEGENGASGADKPFHIEVPQEDFGNWLDQLESKASKAGGNNIGKKTKAASVTPVLLTDSEDERPAVKAVSSDVEEAAAKSGKKKKKKTEDNKSEDKSGTKKKKKKDKEKVKDGESEKKKEKRKKKKKKEEEGVGLEGEEDRDNLEAFLGSPSAGGGGDYESL
ncbi:rab-like protein 6 [Babylonia areolata]|uniref:rab-like protein 6 n=1 Tax=Babylonia areolata TaxID=304850 RepID=UPI003FD4F48D